MRLKLITAAIIGLMAALGFVAWRNSTQPAVPESVAPPQPSATEPAPPEPADPGIAWTVPAGWSSAGPRVMRLDTYVIAGAHEVECAVYYFGPGQGGTVDQNIERWIGEFENPERPERAERTVRGMKVTRARVHGAYQSHGDPAAQAAGDAGVQKHHQLLAAIVEGPAGPVFFKLTGPSEAVDRAAADFDRMIASMQPKAAR